LHVNKYILPNIQAKHPNQTTKPNNQTKHPNQTSKPNLAIMSYTQHGIQKKVNNMKFKVMIIGDEKSGKTSYINRMVNRPFCVNYKKTFGVEVNPLVFRTNIGHITLNMWDCAGNTTKNDNTELYCKGSHACIILSDIRNNGTNNEHWKNKYQSVYPNKPIIYCSNKIDKVNSNDINNSQYYNLSVKCNLNLKEPFHYLIKKLTNNNAIRFYD
jgi:small GTP-binding protein